ncbi:unnamed protein product, partial [Pylaiella littoralis]
KEGGAARTIVVPTLRYNIQVDRGVPFSMGLTLKEQADELASAETARFEAKEKEIKKAALEGGDNEAPTPDKGKGGSSKAAARKKKSPEARARRKELAKVKSTLGRLQRRVDGFWYSKLPFAGASGFIKRVLLAMEKDVTLAGGVSTDRIRVYRPLTGAKDYSRAKLRESYEKVSVERAKGYWRAEYSGQRNEIRFKHFVILAGSVLPVWQKVEDVLNANTHTQHERRLRIVRATEKEDEWNKADKEEGKAGGGGNGSSDEGGESKDKKDPSAEASKRGAAGDKAAAGHEVKDKKPCCETCGGSQDVDEDDEDSEEEKEKQKKAAKGGRRGKRATLGKGTAEGEGGGGGENDGESKSKSKKGGGRGKEKRTGRAGGRGNKGRGAADEGDEKEEEEKEEGQDEKHKKGKEGEKRKKGASSARGKGGEATAGGGGGGGGSDGDD